MNELFRHKKKKKKGSSFSVEKSNDDRFKKACDSKGVYYSDIINELISIDLEKLITFIKENKLSD